MFNLTPAHLHLALNHIPIIGIAVASFPIVIGILVQCRTTLATGLLATILCAAAIPTIMESGSKAYDDITPLLDQAGKNALEMHASRADKTTPVIYASALLALLALLTLIKFPKPATWLAFAVLLGNTASILLAVWTADAGGRIRHIEFRPKTPWDAPAATVQPTPAAATPAPSPVASVLPMASPAPSIAAPTPTPAPSVIPAATPNS